MKLISRNESRKAGQKRYFTGLPCPKGHLSERLVSKTSCVVCSTEQRRKWASENRERSKAIRNAWNATPKAKDGQKARSRRWYEKNKDKANENHYKWLARNPDNHETAKAAVRNWARNNPERGAAARARRRAAMLNATPVWADHAEIKKFYKLARIMTEATGTEFHVDHVIPLQHRAACGLHLETNLQILPGLDNQSKGHRVDLSLFN